MIGVDWLDCWGWHEREFPLTPQGVFAALRFVESCSDDEGVEKVAVRSTVDVPSLWAAFDEVMGFAGKSL